MDHTVCAKTNERFLQSFPAILSRLSHAKIVKIVAIRNVSAAKNSLECTCGRGSTPDPTGAAYNAPRTSKSAEEGNIEGGISSSHSQPPDDEASLDPLSAPVLIMKSLRLCQHHYSFSCIIQGTVYSRYTVITLLMSTTFNLTNWYYISCMEFLCSDSDVWCVLYISVLPFVKNAEENVTFAMYFSRQWQDTMFLSLHNFLSVVLSTMRILDVCETITTYRVTHRCFSVCLVLSEVVSEVVSEIYRMKLLAPLGV